jgi:hypothetical protein
VRVIVGHDFRDVRVIVGHDFRDVLTGRDPDAIAARLR